MQKNQLLLFIKFTERDIIFGGNDSLIWDKVQNESGELKYNAIDIKE